MVAQSATMMSQQGKRELFAEVHPRYLKAKKAEKQKILDEFTAVTGYHGRAVTYHHGRAVTYHHRKYA